MFCGPQPSIVRRRMCCGLIAEVATLHQAFINHSKSSASTNRICRGRRGSVLVVPNKLETAANYLSFCLHRTRKIHQSRHTIGLDKRPDVVLSLLTVSH